MKKIEISSLQALFWVTGNSGIQIFQQSCQSEETMKDYLHKLYPARYNIKSKTKKEVSAARVAFMNKVLQTVLTVSEFHFWKQEQINKHTGFAPVLFKQVKISSEKQ